MVIVIIIVMIVIIVIIVAIIIAIVNVIIVIISMIIIIMDVIIGVVVLFFLLVVIVMFAVGVPVTFLLLLVRKSRNVRDISDAQKEWLATELESDYSEVEALARRIQVGNSYGFIVDAYKSSALTPCVASFVSWRS